jgi:hypothetical protein
MHFRVVAGSALKKAKTLLGVQSSSAKPVHT